tara:strand:- start:2315 stop:2500 length:186 start_codon:yes stop_codon:yes gene_type:complete
MSQEVRLMLVDYKNIINWFESAFGKKNNASQGDRNTFAKLNAMSLSVIDELKEAKGDTDEQ